MRGYGSLVTFAGF